MFELLLGVIEFILILSASFGISFVFLRKDLTNNIPESTILRIILGLGAIVLLTFTAASLRFLNIYFFLIILLAGNALFFKNFKSLKGFKLRIEFSVFVIILLIFILINLFYSLFPPTFYDSMVYHLAVPSYYISHGGIEPWHSNYNSNFPLNVEMLYLFSLLGKTVYVPKLLSFTAGIFILLLMFSWYRDCYSQNFFMLPLILFYTIPQVGFLTSSSKTDIVGMMFLFSAFRLFFLDAKKSSRMSLLVFCGILWGLAVGSKYTLVFFLIGFFINLILFKSLEFKKRIISVLVISALVFLCMIPWFVKNSIITGNPVYPYLNSIFKSDLWTSSKAATFASWFRRGSYDVFQYLLFPVEIFVKPYKYGNTAVLGILFLAFIPFLFFHKGGHRTRFMVFSATAGFFLMLFFARVPRYFLPALLLLSIPVASAAERGFLKIPILKKAVTMILIILLFFNLILQVDLQEKFFKGFDFFYKKISGQLKGLDASYLYAIPYYPAVEYLNRNLTEKDTVIYVGESRTFYLKKNFIASTNIDKNFLIEKFKVSKDFTDFSSGLSSKNITHILYNPSGLKVFEKTSALNILSDADRIRLENYLGYFSLVYSFRGYYIYQINKINR